MSPQDTDATKKVVLACMKVMFDKSTFGFLKNGMQKNLPMPEKLASEAAGLVKLVDDKLQNKIPRQVLVPAATMLLLEIAHFVEKAGWGEPTPEDIKAAADLLGPIMQKAFPNPATQPAAAQAAATPGAAPAPAPQPGLIGGQ